MPNIKNIFKRNKMSQQQPTSSSQGNQYNAALASTNNWVPPDVLYKKNEKIASFKPANDKHVWIQFLQHMKGEKIAGTKVSDLFKAWKQTPEGIKYFSNSKSIVAEYFSKSKTTEKVAEPATSTEPATTVTTTTSTSTVGQDAAPSAEPARKKKAPSPWNLYIRDHINDPEIKALPAKERMGRMSEDFKKKLAS